jgi:AraC-like DNA-binding protein
MRQNLPEPGRRTLMTPANHRAASFRFSTDGLPLHERAAAVREMHERCTLRVKPEPMEPLSDGPVGVNITQWMLPHLGIMTGTLRGLRQRVSPEHSAPTGGDDAFLAFNLAGTSVVARGSDQVMVGAGEACLKIRGATGFTVARPKSVRFIGLRFPVSALSPLVPELDRVAVHTIPHGTAALKLLRSYLGLITQESALATFDLQSAAVAHVYDLAAMALGATAERADLAQTRGVRAARLESIKADIAAHLSDENLNIAAIAARHHVSVRYLQKLFEADEGSFSEFVLSARLTRTYRTLTNHLQSNRTISDIAYDVGFNDLSYFNRAFRRRFGLTPSEVRHGR